MSMVSSQPSVQVAIALVLRFNPTEEAHPLLMVVLGLDVVGHELSFVLEALDVHQVQVLANMLEAVQVLCMLPFHLWGCIVRWAGEANHLPLELGQGTCNLLVAMASAHQSLKEDQLCLHHLGCMQVGIAP